MPTGRTSSGAWNKRSGPETEKNTTDEKKDDSVTQFRWRQQQSSGTQRLFREEKSHDEPEPIAPIRKNRPGESLLRSDLLLTVESCAGRHFHVSISSKRRTEGFAQYPPARCTSLITLEAGGLLAAGLSNEKLEMRNDCSQNTKHLVSKEVREMSLSQGYKKRLACLEVQMIERPHAEAGPCPPFCHGSPRCSHSFLDHPSLVVSSNACGRLCGASKNRLTVFNKECGK
jgi:hypothetical protein